MRLTALTLRNFKSIGDKLVRIDFKPITLLFGPNSSGKSTVFQALHYLSEILEHYNCDPGHTGLGGSLDLGGFRNLVHKHDLIRSIHIRVDYSPELPLTPDSGPAVISPELLMLPGGAFYGIDGQPIVSVEMEIRWSNLDSKAFVSTYTVSIDGQPFGSCAGNEITELNFMHPMLRSPYDEEPTEPGILNQYRYRTQVETFIRSQNEPPQWNRLAFRPISFYSQTPSLPGLDGPLNFALMLTDSSRSSNEDEQQLNERRMVEIQRVLTEGFVDSAKRLRDLLRRMIYLGPLREVPTRLYQPERSPNLSRWATGLAAWDILHRSEQPFIDRVNSWLEAKQRLNTGYSVRLKQYKEIEVGSRLMLELTKSSSPEDFGWIHEEIAKLPVYSRVTLWDDTNNLELAAQDVGVGISQLLPVVVAALHCRKGIVSIEQPELHIHPALQTALGDLFIERLPGRTNRSERNETEEETGVEVIEIDANVEGDWQKQAMFLIETHSEHLMLRFLRRIRETHDAELPPGALPLRPDDIAVHYVEPGQDGVNIKHLRIDETGEFVDRWPKGFFEERAEELF